MVGVVRDSINTSEGANLISIVISPYKDVSIKLVDELSPRTPNHCLFV